MAFQTHTIEKFFIPHMNNPMIWNISVVPYSMWYLVNNNKINCGVGPYVQMTNYGMFFDQGIVRLKWLMAIEITINKPTMVGHFASISDVFGLNQIENKSTYSI